MASSLFSCYSSSVINYPLQALLQEISYASYLSIYTVILPSPKNREQASSYARAVNAAFSCTNDVHVSIRITISPNPDLAWELWDSIRSICNYNPRLSLSKSIAYCPCTTV